MKAEVTGVEKEDDFTDNFISHYQGLGLPGP
jgi:hypothetical protein